MLGETYPFRPSYRSRGAKYDASGPSSVDSAHYPTAFDVFAKPKQPLDWYNGYDADTSQSQALNKLLYYFQDDNGAPDLDKILSTAEQAAETVQQMSPIVKQVGHVINRQNHS